MDSRNNILIIVGDVCAHLSTYLPTRPPKNSERTHIFELCVAGCEFFTVDTLPKNVSYSRLFNAVGDGDLMPMPSFRLLLDVAKFKKRVFWAERDNNVCQLKSSFSVSFGNSNAEQFNISTISRAVLDAALPLEGYKKVVRMPKTNAKAKKEEPKNAKKERAPKASKPKSAMTETVTQPSNEHNVLPKARASVLSPKERFSDRGSMPPRNVSVSRVRDTDTTSSSESSEDEEDTLQVLEQLAEYEDGGATSLKWADEPSSPIPTNPEPTIPETPIRQEIPSINARFNTPVQRDRGVQETSTPSSLGNDQRAGGDNSSMMNTPSSSKLETSMGVRPKSQSDSIEYHSCGFFHPADDFNMTLLPKLSKLRLLDESEMRLVQEVRVVPSSNPSMYFRSEQIAPPLYRPKHGDRAIAYAFEA